MFVSAEQVSSRLASRQDEVAAKVRLLREWLVEAGERGIVLGGADAVAWITGGLTSPVERGAPAGPLRIALTADSAVVVTTNVELARIEAEASLEAIGFELHAVDWFAPGSLDQAAAAACGAPPEELAADGIVGFGSDRADDLIALRLALVPTERGRLAELALDSAEALEDAVSAWRPGERDRDLAARIDERFGRLGAFAPCLIVGGDERVTRYRHPLATGQQMRRLVMAVAVVERGGLHAALTRFATAGPLASGVRASTRAARSVEAAMLAACTAGATYGEVLGACDRAYAASGHPGAWREHFQGGPIGYRQREFEIVPSDTVSRWYATLLAEGHALAWNPSVTGGGKREDTYLLEADGLRRLTSGGSWPLDDGRPAILDVETGDAA
jgi:Xaa-Pro aminopeptidase